VSSSAQDQGRDREDTSPTIDDLNSGLRWTASGRAD
jgi:hypothetical protein